MLSTHFFYFETHHMTRKKHNPLMTEEDYALAMKTLEKKLHLEGRHPHYYGYTVHVNRRSGEGLGKYVKVAIIPAKDNNGHRSTLYALRKSVDLNFLFAARPYEANYWHLVHTLHNAGSMPGYQYMTTSCLVTRGSRDISVTYPVLDKLSSWYVIPDSVSMDDSGCFVAGLYRTTPEGQKDGPILPHCELLLPPSKREKLMGYFEIPIARDYTDNRTVAGRVVWVTNVTAPRGANVWLATGRSVHLLAYSDPSNFPTNTGSIGGLHG